MTDKVITVNHPNGFKGVLYGERSLSIYFEGEEVLHTGSRNVHTEKELFEELEEMPEFMKMFNKIHIYERARGEE